MGKGILILFIILNQIINSNFSSAQCLSKWSTKDIPDDKAYTLRGNRCEGFISADTHGENPIESHLYLIGLVYGKFVNENTSRELKISSVYNRSSIKLEAKYFDLNKYYRMTAIRETNSTFIWSLDFIRMNNIDLSNISILGYKRPDDNINKIFFIPVRIDNAQNNDTILRVFLSSRRNLDSLFWGTCEFEDDSQLQNNDKVDWHKNNYLKTNPIKIELNYPKKRYLRLYVKYYFTYYIEGNDKEPMKANVCIDNLHYDLIGY